MVPPAHAHETLAPGVQGGAVDPPPLPPDEQAAMQAAAVTAKHA
jgi:hypothetical protein